MWKSETPEVRAKYHQKSQEIKARMLALHPNYRYAPRKSSEIRRRATRRASDVTEIPPIQPYYSQPASPPRSQGFEHSAHCSVQANNEKAGIRPNSDITRRVPGAQRFLPPAVQPGWTPYHLLPTAKEPIETTLAQEAPARESEVPVGHGLDMNDGQAYAPTLEEPIDNWDVDADIARILQDI